MRAHRALLAGVVATGALTLTPAPALAFNPLKPACTVLKVFVPVLGGGCAVAKHGLQVLRGGAKLLTGGPAAGVGAIVGTVASDAASASARIALVIFGKAVLGAAAAAFRQIAGLIDRVTRPNLAATWFSGTYWRMTGIAALLTLPFLFACAIQCLVRSELAPLIQAALAYLPLAAVAIAVAAPVTMLLLAATDELCGILVQGARPELSALLERVIRAASTVTAVSGSPFLALLIGLLAAAAALVLWSELLLRSAAVYVVVLMLPLVFAALVWPARRVWAVRLVELLVALILSKFAIVAVLSLGGAALAAGTRGSLGALMNGTVLVMLGAFAPWAMLRLLPHFETAGAAVGSLGSAAGRGRVAVENAGAVAFGLNQGIAARAAEASADHPTEEAAQGTLAGLALTRSPERADAATGDAAAGDAATGDAATGDAATGDAATGDAATGDAATGDAAAGDEPRPAPELAPASEAAPAAAADPAPAVRMPGLDERWQQPNMSWEPLVLGPELFAPAPAEQEPMETPAPAERPGAAPSATENDLP